MGFDACGIAPAKRLDSQAEYMEHWVANGLHGQMNYFERNRDKRYDPTQLVPGAQTVLVCLLTFEHSGRDYHRRVKSMLYTLDAKLQEVFGSDIVSQTHQHIFCDSAPFLERAWCVEAGLGFIGKNRQLIHPKLGSLVHPGEIVLNLPVANDTQFASELPLTEPFQTSTPSDTQCTPAGNNACDQCQLCIEACPTGALRSSVWDATQCVAYTTHHCLACQKVCPYNQNKYNSNL